MSEETDTTRWSLPGLTDMPRDELKLQMEVYGETILLRSFGGDANWVKTVSADAIAHTLTQHLGFSSGLLPKEALWWNQARRDRWSRSGGRQRCGRWPCNGKPSSFPPGSGSRCRG